MTFNFFQFWKKSEPKSKISVSEIPIFSSLGPAELELIENKIRRVEYKRGDIVYRIGEKAEAFYIILLGRFRVLGLKGEILTILSQGDYFGESSILLNRNHSATIEAKNDGLVLRIEKKDFQNLISQIPSLSLHLSRTLGHRLTKGSMRSEVSKTKIISFCHYEAEYEKRIFIRNLAATLATHGKSKTILLGLESETQNKFPDREKNKLSLAQFQTAEAEDIQKMIYRENEAFDFLCVQDGTSEDRGADTAMASLVGYLTDQYDFVLIDLPTEFSALGVKALQQSDLIYFLLLEENRFSSKALSFLREFETSFGFTSDEIRLILCEQKEKKREVFPRRQRSKGDAVFSVFSVLPYEKALHAERKTDSFSFAIGNPETSYARTIRFLARELTGKLVGLVLGSGAAFGFAHIGVLRVLEREKIPVDIIAGSSIGALVGAMWASGMDSHELEQVSKELDRKSTFFKLIGFRDLSFPHRGFFKGDQIVRYVRSFLDRKTFRMLNIPVKIVASNLFTGEEVIFDEGDVVDAIRASISIPGIFRAVKYQGQYLIDGGVVDPLPVKVLSRYGVKKIIAVNVLSAAEDHIQRQEYYETQKAQWAEEIKKKGRVARIWFGILRWFEKRFTTNIFNVLMNTIQFLEYGMAESASAGADIVIHPVLSDSHWAEFYSTEKFIRRGEEKTLEQLSEIRRLVEEGA